MLWVCVCVGGGGGYLKCHLFVADSNLIREVVCYCGVLDILRLHD